MFLLVPDLSILGIILTNFLLKQKVILVIGPAPPLQYISLLLVPLLVPVPLS